MSNQNTWLSGPEVAEQLAIRPSRAAQLMRCGLIPYQTAIGGPLVHQRDLRLVVEQLPDLLHHFQVEKEVDGEVEIGVYRWEPESYTRPSTVKLLRCVQRHEGSFPS